MQKKNASQPPGQVGSDPGAANSRRSFKISDPLGMTRLRINVAPSAKGGPALRTQVPNESQTVAARLEKYTRWLGGQNEENEARKPQLPVTPDSREAASFVVANPQTDSGRANQIEPDDAHVHYTTNWQAAISNLEDRDQITSVSPSSLRPVHRPASKPGRSALIPVGPVAQGSSPDQRGQTNHDQVPATARPKSKPNIRIDARSSGIKSQIANINRRAVGEQDAEPSVGSNFAMPIERKIELDGLQRVDSLPVVRGPHFNDHPKTGVAGVVPVGAGTSQALASVANPVSVESTNHSQLESAGPAGQIESDQGESDMSNSAGTPTASAGTSNSGTTTSSGRFSSPAYESLVRNSTTVESKARDASGSTDHSQPGDFSAGGASIRDLWDYSIAGPPRHETIARVDDALRGGETPGQAKETSESTGTRREDLASKDLLVSVAAWEVNDFSWPQVVENMVRSDSSIGLGKSTLKMLSPANNRLIVTSPARQSGATTIAAVTARRLAQAGRKVLLVDADFTKPDLSRQLGLPVNHSWLNVVNANRDPGDAVVQSTKTGICIMPLVRVLTRVTWPRFFLDTLSPLIERLRPDFDVVLVDVGPIDQFQTELSSADRLIDAVLVVNNLSRPELGGMDLIRNSMTNLGIEKIAFAENIVPVRSER